MNRASSMHLCTETKESGKISASGQRTSASFSKMLLGPNGGSYNSTKCPPHVSALISYLQMNVSPHTPTNPITAILDSWQQQIHQNGFLCARSNPGRGVCALIIYDLVFNLFVPIRGILCS